MIDEQKMNRQETYDFNTTKKIMTQIFTAYGYQPRFVKSEPYSVYDADMNVGKKSYVVEIKDRQQNMDLYDTLPLTVQKYCNLTEVAEAKDATPIVVYLLNNEEYYIFNLDKLCLCKCDIKNWYIYDVQFEKDVPVKKKKPTIFMPVRLCDYNGLIPQN